MQQRPIAMGVDGGGDDRLGIAVVDQAGRRVASFSSPRGMRRAIAKLQLRAAIAKQRAEGIPEKYLNAHARRRRAAADAAAEQPCS